MLEINCDGSVGSGVDRKSILVSSEPAPASKSTPADG
jgi:hypothetical protein